MSLKKNLISNFILTGSTIILPLITFPYITRILSNESLGNVFFIDSFTQYFILFASLGVPFYGVREIAKRKNDQEYVSKLVIDLVSLQFILSIVYILLFFLLGLFIPKLISNITLIKIGALMILANAFSIEWFYQGIENFSYITVRSLVIKVASVISILFLVQDATDSVVYYSILSGVVIANATLNFGYFFKNYFTSFNFKITILKHIKPLIVLFSINASLSVYVLLDSIILGFLTDSINVSFYNIPLKLVKIFWMIIAGIGMVFVPRISALFGSERNDEIKVLMTKSISMVLLLALPFCLFCILFAKDILLIISGVKYIEASSALQVLSVIPLIIGLCNVFGTQFLLPIGKEKKILYATIIGLIVSLTINFSLIPSLKFMGSAIAAVAAEFSVCLYVYFAAKKEIKILLDKSLISQILLCLCGTLIFYLVVAVYFSGLYLMVITSLSYIVFLLISQYFFKNIFLGSLINIKIF
jgi:O-antigen/teichoic acid export membrane protein